MKHIFYPLALTASIIILFVTVPVASAHRPEEGDIGGVTRIPDPTTSYAYYRELMTPGEVHVYEVEVAAGQFFHAGINIPQLDGLEDYGVSLVLLGPGLPALNSSPSSNSHDSSPSHSEAETPAFQHATDLAGIPLPDFLEGAVENGLLIPSQEGDEFFEPFTQTNYWGRQTVDVNLPETSTYYLLVWNPDGRTGKYVLDTGTQEVFGPLDLLRFPVWWFNTRAYFGQGPSIIIGLLVSLSALIGVIIYRRYR